MPNQTISAVDTSEIQVEKEKRTDPGYIIQYCIVWSIIACICVIAPVVNANAVKYDFDYIYAVEVSLFEDTIMYIWMNEECRLNELVNGCARAIVNHYEPEKAVCSVDNCEDVVTDIGKPHAVFGCNNINIHVSAVFAGVWIDLSAPELLLIFDGVVIVVIAEIGQVIIYIQEINIVHNVEYYDAIDGITYLLRVIECDEYKYYLKFADGENNNLYKNRVNLMSNII